MRYTFFSQLIYFGFNIFTQDKDLIFLVPTGSQMEKAGKKLNLKVAAEIFADRNYEDDGNLVSRKKNNAMITDPEIAKEHVIKMIENQSINCYSGKQIPCDIDSICVHGDVVWHLPRSLLPNVTR